MLHAASGRLVYLAGLSAALLLAIVPQALAQLAPYSQDFEGLVQSDTSALANDGWLVFDNVFDSGGGFKFGQGPFPAPNDGAAFSEIVAGQGGAAQGSQQLRIFNDYDCCAPNHGHLNATDRVESSVYQEQTIGAADVGNTWTFRYDAKGGDLCCDTTAIAFIRTLDPNAGFSLTKLVKNDTTNLPATWETYELSLAVDGGLVGQILQFGFASTAQDNEASSNYYDNVDLFVPVPVDTDGDGVPDVVDNCTEKANPAQIDSNGDGIGNYCDPDLDDNCIVNATDVVMQRSVFFTSDPDADLDGNGTVNAVDLGIMSSLQLSSPGPSGIPNLCDP